MKKSIVILLVVVSFLTGVFVTRFYDWYNHGKLEKELLKENEMLEKQYKILNERFEMVENEIQKQEKTDSVSFLK